MKTAKKSVVKRGTKIEEGAMKIKNENSKTNAETKKVKQLYKELNYYQDEICKLHDYLFNYYPEEISKDSSVIDTAIRVMTLQYTNEAAL